METVAVPVVRGCWRLGQAAIGPAPGGVHGLGRMSPGQAIACSCYDFMIGWIGREKKREKLDCLWEKL